MGSHCLRVQVLNEAAAVLHDFAVKATFESAQVKPGVTFKGVHMQGRLSIAGNIGNYSLEI